MAFSRAGSLRSCYRAARQPCVRRQLPRLVPRRAYSSAGQATLKAGGDAAWAAGAVAVTVPSCWYILSKDSKKSHGHDEHHDLHAKAHDEEEDAGDTKDEDNTKDKEESEAINDDEKSEDSENPQYSDEPGKGRVKREEAVDQTSTESTSTHNTDGSDEKTAASEVSGDQNTQISNQEGLSNADTKHTDIGNNAETSRKSEGSLETAKTKGTVDPSRPVS